MNTMLQQPLCTLSGIMAEKEENVLVWGQNKFDSPYLRPINQKIDKYEWCWIITSKSSCTTVRCWRKVSNIMMILKYV